MNITLFSINDKSQRICSYRFDVNHLRDPIGQKHLRSSDGRNVKVQDFLKVDPRVDAIVQECLRLAYLSPPSRHLSISFSDHRGRYIAAGVAEIVGGKLKDEKYQVKIEHLSLS